MADALEKTKDLFSVDDFNEDDISDKSKLIKALENPFGEFRPKEEIVEKAKATGTGLLTGTLGIPSDATTLASAVSSGVAKYADSPTAMMLKDVLEKAKDDVGRPAFDKWFTETTGLESNPENVDQLVGEVLSPTGAFLAPVKTLKNIFAPLKKGVTDFFDKMPPPDSGLAVETAGVGQLNQTKKLLDKEKTFVADNVTTIPPQEFINAPKTTKMSMAGNKTPTGKKQIEKFRELDKTKKYNPDELFEKTGVYKGEDGKFRWEIDTSDAELKNLDTIKNAKDEDAFALSNLLKFDRLYQEYFEPIKVSRPSSVYKGQSARFNYKPIKNLSVIIKRGSDEDAGALASYSPSSDRITVYPDRILSSALKSKDRYPDVSINDLYKYRLESSILHEVQHAIQGREGFTRGSNTENFLPKTYEQDIKTNKKLLDDSYVNFFDQFKAEDVLRTNKDRYDVDSASNSIQSIIGADLNNIKDPTIVNMAFRDAMSKLRDVNLRTPLKEKIVNGYIQRVQQYFQNKKLIDNEYDKAYNNYRDTYGEKEARLVQDRFEKRLNLKSQSKDIQDEMSKTKIPEDMMGTTRAEKERLSKLARTDPVTGKVKRKVSIRNLAKGGDMNKQMEMFEDGGLKEEGGTIDPVSGNDVPPGSTQEEVRDDIPAQLSEGEFVFPADVVRYIGLEKLMRMRQEAKQGLKMMEEMGQMGNSEEATMPDDLPFDETDLDIEDDLEYNKGGVVQAQSGTFVNPGTGVSYVPSQFAGQQLPSYQPPQPPQPPQMYQPPQVPGATGGYRPTFYNEPDKKITTPTYSALIGSRPGQYDEFRTYKNESGFELQIPFKNGQPIYPIPEGYTFVDPEKVEAEDVTTKQVTPQTTKVVDEGGDDPDSGSKTSAVDLVGDPYSYKSMFDMDDLDKTMKDIAFSQLSLFDGKTALSRGLSGQINVADITLNAQKQAMQEYKSNLPKGYNLVNLQQPGRDLLAQKLNDVKDTYEAVLTDEEGNPLSLEELVAQTNRIAKDTVKGARKLSMKDFYMKGTNVINKNFIKDVVALTASQKRQEKQRAENVKKNQEANLFKDFEKRETDTFGKGVGDPLGLDFGSSYEESDYSPSTDFGGTESTDTQQEEAGGSFVGDDPSFQQGGLLKKKKHKIKKMKRGGLASKK